MCWGYLTERDYTWWYTERSIAFMTDPEILSGLLSVGAIGLIGLISGMFFGRSVVARRWRSARQPGVLGHLIFGLWVSVALFLSYVSGPSATIFREIYTAEVGPAGDVNFNASATLAYTFLAAAFIDAERERRPRHQVTKRAVVLAATLFILVFFQLLRGDRDSFGLVVALAALYLTERLTGRHAGARRKRRVVVVAAAGCVVFLAFLGVATLRAQLAEGGRPPLVDAIKAGYNESTWGSVLLTNLSLAAQYHEGRMETEGGRTYWEYVLSLPPGMITRALGVRRPIERDQGPNFWFTDISAGGVHVVTVPFKNFHAVGALLVLLLYGYVIGRSEVIGQSGGWRARLWYASVFVGSAQWFWYGDICFIREIMAFVIVLLCYRAAARSDGARTRDEAPESEIRNRRPTEGSA